MRLSKTLHTVVLSSLCAFSALPAQAATILPVSGTTAAPLAYPGTWNAVPNIIDGIADYDSELILGSEGLVGYAGPYSVEFDLGGNFDLTSMMLWNNAGYLGNDGEGINGFQLRFLDTGKSELGTFNSNANDSLNPQSFGFAASNVRYIDLLINSNHNQNRGYVALYEINFTGVVTAAVPEPETYAMLLAGLGLVGFAVRRRAASAY